MPNSSCDTSQKKNNPRNTAECDDQFPEHVRQLYGVPHKLRLFLGLGLGLGLGIGLGFGLGLG